MYRIAYLVCILAAAALCSAVDVEPRGEPGSHLNEAANPLLAHHLPREYRGGDGSFPDGGKHRRGHLGSRAGTGSRVGGTRISDRVGS